MSIRKRPVKKAKKSARKTRKAKKCSGFKCNVGRLDRVVRFLIGLVGVYLGYYYSPWWYILAVVGLFTSLTGRCAIYSALGIKTR